MGWNYNYYTGAPLTITAQNTINNFGTASGVSTTGYTPQMAGEPASRFRG